MIHQAKNVIPRILRELGINQIINVNAEIESRVNLLVDYLEFSGCTTYVLGISGGVDSTVAGRLAQLACEKAQARGTPAKFIAVRLPYGVQCDEDDAQAAIKFINPWFVETVDIKPASDAMLAEIGMITDPIKKDFILGNIKARQRMIAQYAIAGAVNGLVIGTDHNAEAVMGFFTKFGDGAADITPLVNLNKRQVREIAVHLGAPKSMAFKVPTADLETLNPGLPDEVAYGVTYDEIDDLLEGKTISEVSTQLIVDQFMKTAHKRSPPVTL